MDRTRLACIALFLVLFVFSGSAAVQTASEGNSSSGLLILDSNGTESSLVSPCASSANVDDRVRLDCHDVEQIDVVLDGTSPREVSFDEVVAATEPFPWLRGFSRDLIALIIGAVRFVLRLLTPWT